MVCRVESQCVVVRCVGFLLRIVRCWCCVALLCFVLHCCELSCGSVALVFRCVVLLCCVSAWRVVVLCCVGVVVSWIGVVLSCVVVVVLRCVELCSYRRLCSVVLSFVVLVS